MGRAEPALSGELLLDRCARWARDRHEALALRDGERDWSWGELWAAALAFAAATRRLGVGPGDRVLIALPNGGDCLAALFGCQLAGGVAVPLDPRSGAGRLSDLARFTGAPAVVVPAARHAAVSGALEAPARALSLEGRGERSSFAVPAAGAADALAMLQFTSGATGDPKGVELTHGCLAVNVDQLVRGLAITPGDVFVSWLPLCHDMGLVLMALLPLALGAQLDLLPADAAGLRRWLPTIEARRATFTAAPDFAYRLVRSWYAARGAPPDIRSLRVALDAAEPVRSTTLAAFSSTFGLRGVMTPGYGLAEATVGVTTGRPGEAPRVDAHGLVALGRGLPGVGIRIADREGRALPAGAQGEIEVASPALCRGYYGNPRATSALFRADGWLRTGDVGYLDREGELYVVGRSKNLLLVGGATLAPQEIEEAVDRLPFVRRSAAVGIDRGRIEGELVHVFAEVSPRGRGGEALAELAIRVVEAVHGRLGLRPGRVHLLRAGALPLTETGKVRYQELRALHLAGALRRRGAVLFPET